MRDSVEADVIHSLAHGMQTVSVEENRDAQAEEMEALHSIYGEEDCRIADQFCEVQVCPPDGNCKGELSMRLSIHFPESYPSTSWPIAELNAPWLAESTRQRVVDLLIQIYEEAVGEVVVFRWVEWLKEQAWLWEVAERWVEEHTPPDDKETTSIISQSHMPGEEALNSKTQGTSRMLDEKSAEELDKVLGIVHGEPFTEKKSTFQGHLAAVRSMDEVETVMDTLLQNRKIAGATHNIMAYRISMPPKSTVLQDSDDDGETAAGGRLLHLLQIVDAIDVIVVVSRWYGGNLLGPDRFKHISNAARSLLASCGFIARSGSSNTSHQKSTSKDNPQKGKKK